MLASMRPSGTDGSFALSGSSCLLFSEHDILRQILTRNWGYPIIHPPFLRNVVGRWVLLIITLIRESDRRLHLLAWALVRTGPS